MYPQTLVTLEHGLFLHTATCLFWFADSRDSFATSHRIPSYTGFTQQTIFPPWRLNQRAFRLSVTDC